MISLFSLMVTNLTMVSVSQFSCSVMSDPLRPHGLQHTRPPCPSPTPGVHPNTCPLSQWCRPTISSSVVPFSSHLQSFPESGTFPMSQFFASGGQSIGVSAPASSQCLSLIFTLLFFSDLHVLNYLFKKVDYSLLTITLYTFIFSC